MFTFALTKSCAIIVRNLYIVLPTYIPPSRHADDRRAFSFTETYRYGTGTGIYQVNETLQSRAKEESTKYSLYICRTKSCAIMTLLPGDST